MSMNLTELLLNHANDSWWANWLLFGRKDDMGNNIQLAEGRYLDPTARVMLLRDAASVRDVNHETLVLEQVPSGINIFSLLNLPVPGNVTDLEGWKVIFSSNSLAYGNISNILQSLRLVQWHSEMPDYAYHLLLGLYLPIVIFGSILNTILLGVILSTPKLRIDPRNSFIVALAVSDFFLCNFTSPLTLWSTLEGHWPLGPNTSILCQLVKAGQDFPVIMSSFCIGAIACDRFRFIMQPHAIQMTANQGFLISLLLVIVSCFFVSPVFINSGLWNFPYMLERNFYCEIHLMPETRRYYTVVTSAAHYLLTFTIVGVLYSAIYIRLKSRPPSQHEEVNRRRKRTHILLGCITSVFFVCWGPLVFYTILYEFLPEIFPERSVMASVGYTLSLLIGMLTPIANPLFYGLLNEPFQEVLKKKFSCLFKLSNMLSHLRHQHHHDHHHHQQQQRPVENSPNTCQTSPVAGDPPASRSTPRRSHKRKIIFKKNNISEETMLIDNGRQFNLIENGNSNNINPDQLQRPQVMNDDVSGECLNQERNGLKDHLLLETAL